MAHGPTWRWEHDPGQRPQSGVEGLGAQLQLYSFSSALNLCS